MATSNERLLKPGAAVALALALGLIGAAAIYVTVRYATDAAGRRVDKRSVSALQPIMTTAGLQSTPTLVGRYLNNI